MANTRAPTSDPQSARPSCMRLLLSSLLLCVPWPRISMVATVASPCFDVRTAVEEEGHNPEVSAVRGVPQRVGAGPTLPSWLCSMSRSS